MSKKQLVSSAVDIFSFNSVLLFLNSIDLRIDLWKSKRIVNSTFEFSFNSTIKENVGSKFILSKHDTE